METITRTFASIAAYVADRPWVLAALIASLAACVLICAWQAVRAARGGWFVITAETGDTRYFTRIGETRTRRGAEREAARLAVDEPGRTHTVMPASERHPFE